MDGRLLSPNGLMAAKVGTASGLFALTAHAVGLFDDIGECVDSLLPNRRFFEPLPDHHALYQDLFQVYRSVSRNLLDDFADLDRIRRTKLSGP